MAIQKSHLCFSIQNNSLTSAPEQLRQASKSTLENITINQKPFTKTSIIYSGFHLNSAKHLNLTTNTIELDFMLWFKTTNPNINLANIHFNNATVQPNITATKKTFANQRYYQRLHITGTFNINSFATHAAFGSHYIGIDFRHKTNDQSQVIFVSDNIKQSKDITTAMNNISNWKPKKIIMIPGVTQEPTFGDPENRNKQITTFSSLNIISEISKEQLNIRRILNPTQQNHCKTCYFHFYLFYFYYRKK